MIPRMPRPLYIIYRVGEMLVSLLSRFINAAFLRGSTRQTTSARAHIEALSSTGWKRGKRIINMLFFWQDDHCRWAWEREIEAAKKTLKRARTFE